MHTPAPQSWSGQPPTEQASESREDLAGLAIKTSFDSRSAAPPRGK
jgi:hypothetical protein